MNIIFISVFSSKFDIEKNCSQLFLLLTNLQKNNVVALEHQL